MSVAVLRRCVGDVDLFLEKHWAEAPLLRRAEVSDFDDLASFDDLDRMISSLGLRASSLRMVKDGATLSQSSYTTAPSGKRSLEPLVNAAAVYERYEEGATIVLESLHKYWQPLADFCRDLELALGHRLQVNAYITPRGSQGFDVHRDDHDVFVLQVHGEKHWTVYDRTDDEVVIIDEPITKGSALYIPKGFPHSARTGLAASAHLTVGILTLESIDVLKELVKLAEAERVFQTRLDTSSTSDADALRAVTERTLDDLRTWLDSVDVDALVGQLARRFKSTSQPLFRGQLRQLELLDDLGSRSIVRRRRGASCFLLRSDEHLKVVLSDRELNMPLLADEAMRMVSDAESFVISDLHRSLEPEGALVLTRRLIREGLLEVVVGD